jgi:predicted amidophosphoribosyltransferase
MVNINPVKIFFGVGRVGYALDYHTVSSTHMGDDEYGHPVFDTKRSEVGELLYRLKCRSDASALGELVSTAVAFVREWRPPIGVVVPVPPTRTERSQQPVMLLAQRLAEDLGLPAALACVVLRKDMPELKKVFDYKERLRLLVDAYAVSEPDLEAGKRVLLVDDLYRSGATMNAVTEALLLQGPAAKVYALAFTRTRRHR